MEKKMAVFFRAYPIQILLVFRAERSEAVQKKLAKNLASNGLRITRKFVKITDRKAGNGEKLAPLFAAYPI